MSADALRGNLERDVAMSGHTSWRVGGPADRVYQPADLEDLCAFLKTVPDGEPLYFIGLGSNLLVRDGGVRGTVIHLHAALKELRLEDRGQIPNADISRFGLVYAEAGVASPKLPRFAADNDLYGVEFLAGIPGTLGGALAMNAGTQAAKEAANMVDLDSDPTKLIEVVEIGKQLLMTRGAPAASAVFLLSM